MSEPELSDETEAEREERIQRRTFLTRSALASGALIATGCGASLPASSMGGDETQALLSRLERGLGRIRGVPRGDIARELTWQARPDLTEAVVRQTLESLIVSDVARSLPVGERVPAPLAARLTDELPVLRRSLTTHHALLARMPGAARRGLDRRITREPDAPTEVCEWIDRHAAEIGTARSSRMKLRLAARDVKARLRRQSADAVIDDCVRKVERVAARSGGSLTLGHSARTQAMVQAIWQQQVPGVPTTGGAGGALSTPGNGAAPPPGSGSDEDMQWSRFLTEGERFWSADWRRPGDEERQIGSIMMPFGAISCGLMAIVGLIVLLVGVAQNSSWDGEPREL